MLRNDDSGPYLGEQSVDEEVQEAAEQLIPDQDRDEQVTENHSTRELDGVWPVAGSGKTNADDVKREDEGKEFPERLLSMMWRTQEARNSPVCVEPQLPDNPLRNLLLGLLGPSRLRSRRSWGSLLLLGADGVDSRGSQITTLLVTGVRRCPRRDEDGGGRHLTRERVLVCAFLRIAIGRGLSVDLSGRHVEESNGG